MYDGNVYFVLHILRVLRSMVKEFFIQVFHFLLSRFIIFLFSLDVHVCGIWYMERALTRVLQASIKIACRRMWHIHLIWFIHKKRYNTLKIFSTNHSTGFFFFKYFNKGICVCMVAQYIMRSIAVLLLQLNYATFVSLGDYLTL